MRAGALAEARWGAARGHRNFLFVPVGTGIGGSLVIDGEPYPGAHSLSVELGHTAITPRAVPVAAALAAAWKTISSAVAVASRYRALSGEEGVDARGVAERAGRGDAAAGAGRGNGAVEGLATALATVVTRSTRKPVVVGGGLAGAGRALLDPLIRSLHGRLNFHTGRRWCRGARRRGRVPRAAILAWRRAAAD